MSGQGAPQPDPTSELRLDGRVAVVVGAGGGLGRAIADVLAAAGAAVLCADVDASAAGATAEHIVTTGGRAHAHVVDITDPAAHSELVGAATEWAGPIRIWVNSAGIMREGRLVDLDPADLAAVMGVNFTGAFLGSQAAARHMAAHGEGGAIVNVASAIIDAPQPKMGAYGASKAALSHLTRTLAVEVGRYGIRANLVAPGWTRTGMTEGGHRNEEGHVDEEALRQTADVMAQVTPLRRAAEPLDTARAVLWLVSDAGAFVTGQTIRPHGGVTAPW